MLPPHSAIMLPSIAAHTSSLHPLAFIASHTCSAIGFDSSTISSTTVTTGFGEHVAVKISAGTVAITSGSFGVSNAIAFGTVAPVKKATIVAINNILSAMSKVDLSLFIIIHSS